MSTLPLSFLIDLVAQRGYGDLEKLVDLLPGKSDYDRSEPQHL